MSHLRETDLYPPVKAWLERQGYEVKSEVGAADVVGVKAAQDPVIVELKTRFSLTLLHQAVARQAVTDNVYVAVPRWLCKRAGRYRCLVVSDPADNSRAKRARRFYQ